MRNTLVWFASPHKNGATAQLLRAYLAREGISDYTLFDCFDRAPAPCTDCGYCKAAFACAKRDLDDLYAALEDCDRLIIATPVYNAGLPAPLKAVVDRLQVYFSARFVRGIRPPIARHKDATVLLCGGAERDVRETVLAQLLPAFTVINAELADCISVTGTDRGDAAERIADALNMTTTESHSDQERS